MSYYNTAFIQAFTAAFIPSMQVIPPTLQNGAQGFAVAFPAICPILPPQIPDRHKRIKCSLHHAGTYHSAVAPLAHTRYHRHAGRCTGQHSRPIIIRYIRVAVRPCYRSMPDGAADRRPCKPGGLQSGTGQQLGAHRLAHSTRRGNPAAEARRAARNH